MSPRVKAPRPEAEFERLAYEWDELADRTNAPPHLRPGWFSAWWDAFGRGRPALFSTWQEGRLAGVLPMGRRGGHLYGLANYHSPAFGPLAENGEASADLLTQAVRSRPRRLSLALLDEHDPALLHARAASNEGGYRVLERPQMRAPFITLEEDWPRQLATLNRRFRKELSRQRRRIEELGEVRFDIETHRDHLEEVLAVERSGWKDAAGTAIESRAETRRFYDALASWAAERGLLRLLFLRVNGRAVAVDYALEHGEVRYMLKGGFDTEYARVGPGNLLLADGLREAIASGLSRIELGCGEERYKLRWSSTAADRKLIQAFAPSPRGYLDWAAFAYGRFAVKRAQGRLGGRRGA